MTSTLPVPASLSGGVSFRTVDIDKLRLTATADATGTAVASGATQGPDTVMQQGQWMRIERIVITGNSLNGCEAGFYEGDAGELLLQNIEDWTPLPSGDVGVSEYPSFLTIRPTRCLTVQITGANKGENFFVSATYQLCVKAPGPWPSS